ncbi:hypothetical protein MTR67_030696 [Solanum verrucosum]|uniref:Chromo domain-containing protein n=1 Tax=Solanum verrucosum TaxID=315347 RepID=A0AAF0TYA5_SOLVR|nr:hypothetical protein MTR67_030696 [Solanum verrucosum]
MKGDMIVGKKGKLSSRYITPYIISKRILDGQVRKLRTKEVASVKVIWRKQFVEEATWEAEEDMNKRYPHLFESGEIPDQAPTFSQRIIMSEMLPSEQNQESAVWSPISSPPHDHFNNDLENEESIIFEYANDKVVDEIEEQKATEKGKLPTFELYELKCVCPKIGGKGKSPMPEFYELKNINKPSFSNLIQGGTSDIKLKKEDNYDYYQDVAILKSIYHYFFNHGVIPYPNYSENFINYIEVSIPNLKFRGQALKTKIILLERRFVIILKIAEYDPNIINPIHREIFDLSIG